MSIDQRAFSFTTDNFLPGHSKYLLITFYDGQLIQVLSVAKTTLKMLENSGARYINLDELSPTRKEQVKEFVEDETRALMERAWKGVFTPRERGPVQ